MCVIYYCRSEVPSDAEIHAGEDCNGHGGGVAWFDRENKEFPGIPTFKKDINADGVIKLIKERNIKPPFFIHFRIASVGGIEPELCHPFPIDPRPSTALEGTSPGGLLLHNGTWSGWRSEMREAVQRSGGKIQIPDREHWSDSRALAWLSAVHGVTILPFLSGIDHQRIGVLTNDRAFILGEWLSEKGQGWAQSSSTYRYGSSTGAGFARGHKRNEEGASCAPTPRGADGKFTRVSSAQPEEAQVIGRGIQIPIECWGEAELASAVTDLRNRRGKVRIGGVTE